MKKSVKRLFEPISRRVAHSLLYSGRERYCPVCEKHSRLFKPIGVNQRPDAQFPFCGALERHRLLWVYLHTKTDLLKQAVNGTMLHVAPEAILESKFRPLLGSHYLTADYLDPDADVKMDITDIHYPDQSFAAIYCSHVLEHVPDDRRAMREFHRVLKKGGWAILLVPITADKTFEDPTIVDPKERLRLFGQKDHVRRYGPDYQERLEQAGFHVERIRATDLLSPSELKTMGIKDTAGDLYICRHANEKAKLAS